MALYAVSYDLHGDHSYEAYARIYDFLKTAAAWCTPLYSFWIIDTPETPRQIIDKMFAGGVIDDGDGIVVLELTGVGDFRRVSRGPAHHPFQAVDWLNNTLTRR
jgi:hypothetical protein